MTVDERGRTQFHFCNKDDLAYRASRQFFEDASAPARSLFLQLGKLKHELDAARQQQR